jgi:hypothetical protein
MTRPIRALLVLLAVSFALVATACADVTGPRPNAGLCDVSNNNICPHADVSNNNI